MSECEICGDETEENHRKCYTCEVADFEHLIGEIASMLSNKDLTKRQQAVVLREVPLVLDNIE